MTTRILRHSQEFSISVAQSQALSGALDYTLFASGVILTPAVLEATTKIAFKIAEKEGGTFLPLYDKTNALVEITVAVNEARAYPLPEEIFGVRWFKLWCEASGSDVAQTAQRNFTIVLKG